MLSIVCIIELESQIGQVEKLFRVVEEMQQHDILELVNRAREWQTMANWLMVIKTFLGMNRESSSASVEGNLGDIIRDIRVSLLM